MKARVAKLGHIGLAVEDLDRSVDFYVNVLGMKLTERFAYPKEKVGHGVSVREGAFVRCDATHHVLSIFVLSDPDTSTPTKPRLGLHHIAFELPSPEALLQLYRDMNALGVVVNARRGGPGNQPRFYARDPDNNLLEFYWGIDQIGWDGLARSYDPIQEIDLSAFDFSAFVEQREQASKRLHNRVGGSDDVSSGSIPS